MSKTVLADVEGFTPCIDILTQEYGVMVSAVFGRVWRYCQGEHQVCDASLETIADELRMGYMTVLRHIKLLVKEGYLEDLTPKDRYKPHAYRDTGKVHVTLSIAAGLPKREIRSTNLVDEGLPNWKLKKELKIEIKKEKIEEEAPPLSEGITYFLRIMRAKRLNDSQRDALIELEQTYGTSKLKEMVDWCGVHGMGIGKAILSMKTAAPTWGQKNGRSNGHASQQPKGRTGAIARARAEKEQNNGER